MNASSYRQHPTALFLFVLLGFFCGVFPAMAEPTDPGGGIGGTGITGFGVVQKFGSIFVNGREYFIDGNTRITRDGAPSNEKALRLGDVVNVQGRIDAVSGRSTASHIDSELAVQGAVERVDPASGTLTVLGQVVYVVPDTLGDSLRDKPLLPRIRRGERVAVSGLARSGGSWTATRIARLAPGDAHFLLRGRVQGVDRAHGQVTVGGQVLTLPAGMRFAPPATGDVVRVSGHYEEAALRLESVQADRPALGPVGRTVEISGYVQRRPRAGALVSNNVVLRYSNASAFIGGSAADLRANVPVAVRGQLRPDGSVAISTIRVDAEPMRVTLQGFEAHTPRKRGERQPPGNGSGGNAQPEKSGTEPPGLEKREVDRPDNKPEIEKPQIERPEIDRPEIERPEIEKPSGD
ncbi:MAG: DUF5666 domain-containing protein [Sulfuricaulis sp.]